MKTKNCFLRLNAGQKYRRMLQKSILQKYRRMLRKTILQYFRPSFSFHLSVNNTYVCIFLSCRFRQVLLYSEDKNNTKQRCPLKPLFYTFIFKCIKSVILLYFSRLQNSKVSGASAILRMHNCVFSSTIVYMSRTEHIKYTIIVQH